MATQDPHPAPGSGVAGRPPSILIGGPAGDIEVLTDFPKAPARGIVLIGHPQPLLGGSAAHKVPHALARALQDEGWLVGRPNFRGVGKSQGHHDHGVGETEDMLTVAAHLRSLHAGLPLALVGFSFGAFVQSRVASRLDALGVPPSCVVLAGLPVGTVEGKRRYEPEPVLPKTLVVHGELDDRVPLSAVLDWCRPQAQPVMVVPGVDHFFSGRLPLLRLLVSSHLSCSTS